MMTAVLEQVRAARYQAAGTIAATPPFDFARSLAFLGHFPPMRDEQALSPGTLTKAVMVEGRPIVCRVEPAGTVKAPCLAFSSLAGHRRRHRTLRRPLRPLARLLGTLSARGRVGPAPEGGALVQSPRRGKVRARGAIARAVGHWIGPP
jgi:hypothetical protein